MRTDRWYLCIFFWLLDRVVHQLYVTVIYCAKYKIGSVWWKIYLNKNGRKRLQIDMSRELMNYAISKSWTNLDSAKPDWTRRAAVIPCDCNKCLFCLHSLTTGIDHKRKRRTVTHFVQHDHTRTKTVDCTDRHVNLQRGSDCCMQCYREREGTREQKLKGISKSCKGCPSCNEHICKKCWEKGYDMRQKKKA